MIDGMLIKLSSYIIPSIENVSSVKLKLKLKDKSIVIIQIL